MEQGRFLRVAKVVAYVSLAFVVGIGFAEGLASFGEKIWVSNEGGIANEIKNIGKESDVLLGDDMIFESEMKGSDDSASLPISEYKVVGVPKFVNADAYAVADLETGEFITSKSINEIYPIASVSKLVTALVAEDHIPAREEIVVSKSALATYGHSGGLLSGEKVRAGDLLYPLLLESSNDVALLISEQFPDGQFANLMNEKVADLGMDNSSFEEASGLSPRNLSTAEDLMKLASYIYKEADHLLDITRVREYALLKHTWTNHNYMLRYDTFVGGKNGFTDEALRTTLSIFELPIKRGTSTEVRPIGVVVLHTTTREQDVVRLLDFVKKNVELENASETELLETTQ